jgi:squalene-associated FAD-dependent desaturase
VPVLSPDRPPSWIRRAALPAPAHLAPSLLRFGALGRVERVRAARTATRLRALDPDDPALDQRSFGDWLRAQGESEAAIDGLWDLLVRPTLNIRAREASLALAAMVLRTGFLTDASGADVGFATVPLDHLHAGPAAEALRRAGARVELRARVRAVEAASPPRGPRVAAGGEWIDADAAIVAVPHDAAARILPPSARIDPAALARLGASPIVNLHVVYDRTVTDLPFFVGLGTPLQWVFDRSRAAGLERGQYLAVSLSAADEYDGTSTDELRRIFVPAFDALLPRARAARVVDFFVTREPAATFRQAPGTRSLRPAADAPGPGLFLAGAWTDTGWPATMEGAVRSGQAAAARAIAALARRDRPRAPALAAAAPPSTAAPAPTATRPSTAAPTSVAAPPSTAAPASTASTPAPAPTAARAAHARSAPWPWF